MYFDTMNRFAPNINESLVHLDAFERAFTLQYRTDGEEIGYIRNFK